MAVSLGESYTCQLWAHSEELTASLGRAGPSPRTTLALRGCLLANRSGWRDSWVASDSALQGSKPDRAEKDREKRDDRREPRESTPGLGFTDEAEGGAQRLRPSDVNARASSLARGVFLGPTSPVGTAVSAAGAQPRGRGE